MTKPPASSRWFHESNVVVDEEVLPRPDQNDLDTGVQILRMTTYQFVNSHIYPESPISTPDGKRFFFVRSNPFSHQSAYWIGDIETLLIRKVTDEPNAHPPVVTMDGKWFIYLTGRDVYRMSPDTFERHRVYTVPDEIGPIMMGIRSMSACGRWAPITCQPQQGRRSCAVIDLDQQTTTIVWEHPDCVNPHEQYSKNSRRRILIQVNDGVEHDAKGPLRRNIGENGGSLHVFNDDGSGHTILPIGQSPLERMQGHQCWMGNRDEVISTTHRRGKVTEPWQQRRIVAVKPGDSKYRIVCEGDVQSFTHIHTTSDGRYFVTDCNRTAKIYVGSTSTGKYKLFCSSGATFGSTPCTHPHPFFLGDDKTIGFNSDRTGLPHVYVAPIPDGFLDDLD